MYSVDVTVNKKYPPASGGYNLYQILLDSDLFGLLLLDLGKGNAQDTVF